MISIEEFLNGQNALIASKELEGLALASKIQNPLMVEMGLRDRVNPMISAKFKRDNNPLLKAAYERKIR